jgi:hypothetical protein
MFWHVEKCTVSCIGVNELFQVDGEWVWRREMCWLYRMVWGCGVNHIFWRWGEGMGLSQANGTLDFQGQVIFSSYQWEKFNSYGWWLQSDFCLCFPDASSALVHMSCDSSVITVTRLQVGQSGAWITFSKSAHTSSRSCAACLSMGIRWLSV